MTTKVAEKVDSIVTIDASGVYYRDLNTRLRETVAGGADRIELHNVYGQRYIGTDLDGPVAIDIYGTPGNDLGAFMNGPKIVVHGNAQDGCGNTMNEGEIIVHGHAGDTVGLSARGGKILIREDVGYRAGIHMKEYNEKKPVVVIGGTAQDFLGEYMAGGVLILLGLTLQDGESHRTKFVGTGMHGGVIYVRGNIADYQLGKEVGVTALKEDDAEVLCKYVVEFAAEFGYDADEILKHKFVKLFPRWLRPYGRLYAY
jgi:glutamate synthase domain-containing protein 3